VADVVVPPETTGSTAVENSDRMADRVSVGRRRGDGHSDRRAPSQVGSARAVTIALAFARRSSSKVIASAILRRFPWLETIAIQLTTWPVAQWLVWRTGAFWPMFLCIELGVVIVEIILWRIVLPGVVESSSSRVVKERLPSATRRLEGSPTALAALVSIAANGVTAFLALALV
jgi:hypothetical protein